MRQAVLNLEESKIREVANAGIGRDDVLAFWFGESDEVTPDFIRQAAIDSLQRGETFYSHNLGLPELREAVAGYMSALHGPVDVERIAITSGGVNALMIAVQALVDAGDEVVAVTPVWPNLTAQPAIMGARVKCVPLTPQGGEWTLDLPALLAAITPATKVLIVNAPNNPTGWTLTRAGAAGAARPLPPAPAPGSWPTRSTSGSISRRHGQRLRAEFPGHCRARRPAGGGAQLFQELPDDRLAPGLAGDAARDDAPRRQADRVQHLVRRVFAQRAGLVALERTADVDAARGGASEGLPRHA